MLGFPRFDGAQTMINSLSLAHQTRSCSSLQYKCSQARMFGLQIKSTVLQCHVVQYSAPLCVVNETLLWKQVLVHELLHFIHIANKQDDRQKHHYTLLGTNDN